jgi:hypothetical protein
MISKIPALTFGNLVRFLLLPEHRFDTVGVDPLIAGVELGGLLADEAFDSNAIIADLNASGAKIVRSQHPRRARRRNRCRDISSITTGSKVSLSRIVSGPSSP